MKKFFATKLGKVIVVLIWIGIPAYTAWRGGHWAYRVTDKTQITATYWVPNDYETVSIIRTNDDYVVVGSSDNGATVGSIMNYRYNLIGFDQFTNNFSTNHIMVNIHRDDSNTKGGDAEYIAKVAKDIYLVANENFVSDDDPGFYKVRDFKILGPGKVVFSVSRSKGIITFCAVFCAITGLMFVCLLSRFGVKWTDPGDE
jgi:hypothetical protein